MPVLDATFLIDLKRRPAKTASALSRALDMDEDLVVPMQAAIEYATGIEDEQVAFAELNRAFRLRPCDEEVARESARLARESLRRGRFPGWADVQIAATARLEGMLVLTRNPRHFREALDADVWDYTVSAEPPA